MLETPVVLFPGRAKLAIRSCPDWVDESGHDDWGGRCHLLRGTRRCDGGDDDYARLAFQELEGERCEARVVAFRPTHIEHVIASFGKAVLVHAFLKGVDEKCARLCRAAAQHSNNCGLKLPMRHPRPHCRTAKKGNELAPLQVTELHRLPLARGVCDSTGLARISHGPAALPDFGPVYVG